VGSNILQNNSAPMTPAANRDSFENINEALKINDEKVKNFIAPIIVGSIPNEKESLVTTNNTELSGNSQDAENKNDCNKNQDIGSAQTDEPADESKEDEEDERSNSNNTCTLTQQCSLVAPDEICVSVSPTLTAEPVLTPSEKLKRLDLVIRGKLAEKQKIVCEILRIPNEHFQAIADIAGQPEAPKEPTDLILAAFAQVQTLTELLSEHLKVLQHQEISAVSMSLCDDCNKDCHRQQLHLQQHPKYDNLSSSQIGDGSSATICSKSRSSHSSHSFKSANNHNNPSSTSSSAETPSTVVLPKQHKKSISNDSALYIVDTNKREIIEDENGYCQIDELRLPAINNNSTTISTTVKHNLQGSSQLPSSTNTFDNKRHSITSADTILEESDFEVNFSSDDKHQQKASDNESLIEVNDSTSQVSVYGKYFIFTRTEIISFVYSFR
jgi:Rho guanine nucleotide exchange factor 12